MATEQMVAEKKENGGARERAFASKLGDGLSRFLAHVIEHGLESGRRTPEDFIRHFPPATIMNALEGQPELRANILVIATGIRVKVALKKPAQSCGVDLQIALDEDEVDAETIVTLFDPDDRVRYLDHRALWAYVTEGDFWTADGAASPQAHERAAKHISYMLDRALEDGLLTHPDIVDGITIGKLAELLPRAELEKIVTAAIQAGRSKRPFVDRDLLGATPTSMLVSYVPLPWLWNEVLLPKVAVSRGLVAAQRAPEPAQNDLVSASPDTAELASAEPAVEAAAPPDAEASAASVDVDLDVDEVLEGIDDEEKRKKATYTPAAPGQTRAQKR